MAAGVALVSLLSGSASAQLASPQRGRDLSQKLCTNCHAVEAHPSGPMRADVPSFAAIAARPDVSASKLAGAIIIPHPAMPGVQLTVAEIRDVVAYILSLKEQK
jgi:mono/diheme cytochrome c family protein